MYLRIDPSSDRPIYAQIEEQVRLGIASGRLARGARLPTVRQLAAELGVHVNTVAHAYANLERAGVVTTRQGAGTFVALPAEDERLKEEREGRLNALLGRAMLEALSLGYSIDQIEASFALRLARWRSASETAAAAPSLPQSTIVAIGSHDLVLDVIAGQLRQRTPPVNMVSTHVGSLGGLMALARGEAHLAGCHLLDEETGLYNLPYVKHVLPGQHVVLVNLVQRIQGLMVQRGNPKGITGIGDLAREDIVFVNRQWGSGTRALLEQRMLEAGLRPEQVRGYEQEETTHLAVAADVAGGVADVGLGILAAARALELDFLPLAKERYDLAIPQPHYDSALLRPLLEVLADPAFRRTVAEMGGYDVSLTGTVVGRT